MPSILPLYGTSVMVFFRFLVTEVIQLLEGSPNPSVSDIFPPSSTQISRLAQVVTLEQEEGSLMHRTRQSPSRMSTICLRLISEGSLLSM